MRRSAQAESPEMKRARKRVQKMSTTELIDWADAAGSGMAKGFMDFRKHEEVASLDEIMSGLVALTALTEELSLRCEVDRS